MPIVLEIKNSYSQIKGLDDLSIIDAISRELSYSVGYLTWSQKNSGWDGTYRLLNRKQQFPSGCAPRVIKALTDREIEFSVSDLRTYETPQGGLIWRGRELYDYQKKIVDTCIESKTGMVKAATGAGKSIIIARLACLYNLPTVIYVVSGDLLQQMHDELSTSLDVPIGIIGDGKCDRKISSSFINTSRY